ncbi:alpha- and gamma-adaptin-binding protein p34 isoform X2 [Erinaceus europaeus]|uniref:Alpha- and gamma-adaptin-binding protein p34 isoform X2 n=1 Tax=Erinaceus europaeus TaxID=9365 RepID=A0ABM3W4X2_ERIEU|nr:alpha- and gamma-adaptin-binding protein p34 isoform X2 [Erinaceus europaeus]
MWAGPASPAAWRRPAEAACAAMAARVPCALVASCSPACPGDRLVQHILGTEDPAPAAPGDQAAARFYPWTIDNKYYSADVRLCVVPGPGRVPPEAADCVQALVLCFDSSRKSGLDGVSAWLPLAEAWLPEVQILVCDRVCEDGVSRQQAQEWCIRHGFELVELSPQEVPEEDDDFPEPTGVKRIVQALNANVWSSVVMKAERSRGFSLLSSLAGAQPTTGTAEPCPAERPRVRGAETAGTPAQRGGARDPEAEVADGLPGRVLDPDIQELAGLAAGGGDLDNFQRLFSKLREMKDKAATLPHEQRKVHAEKVAKAFWMAIGGDRDEIEGLSSDEEH